MFRILHDPQAPRQRDGVSRGDEAARGFYCRSVGFSTRSTKKLRVSPELPMVSASERTGLAGVGFLRGVADKPCATRVRYNHLMDGLYEE